MVKYICKRVLLLPVILLFATMLIFVFINLSPVDPTHQMLPAEYTQEMVDELRGELGLDDPLPVRYFNWIKGVLQGDWGTSYATRGPVWDEVAYRIPTTIKLSLLTTLLVILVGMPLGILCAVKQYSFYDGAVNVISKLLGAFPAFWLALMLMLLFCSKLGWFPAYGIKTWDSWILPVVTLALPNIAGYVRNARSSMLDCIRQDYIRTARSKGASEGVVVWRDALRNASLPLITIIGSTFANLVGGAVVVEKVFAIPGVGSKVVEAINTSDTPVVLACTVIISVIFVVVTLLIDIAYAIVDPRIKASFVKSAARKARVGGKTVKGGA